jgi:hypothetical protein
MLEGELHSVERVLLHISQRCTKTDGTYGERTASVRCQATTCLSSHCRRFAAIPTTRKPKTFLLGIAPQEKLPPAYRSDDACMFRFQVNQNPHPKVWKFAIEFQKAIKLGALTFFCKDQAPRLIQSFRKNGNRRPSVL